MRQMRLSRPAEVNSTIDSEHYLYARATAGLLPDMTLLLDLPVEVGLARKRTQDQRNRFERIGRNNIISQLLRIRQRRPLRSLRFSPHGYNNL